MGSDDVARPRRVNAGEAARRESDLSSRRTKLTGGAQEWLAQCVAARRAGGDVPQELHRAGSRDLAALADSPRLWWNSGRTGNSAGREGVPARAGHATGRIGPDLSAAEAMATVAGALAGAFAAGEELHQALDSATSHWEAAGLPAVDGGSFPAGLFTGVDDVTRHFLTTVAVRVDPRFRGFVALLARTLVDCPLPALRHDVKVGVVFDRVGLGHDDGASGVLRLQIRPDGPPGLHPDPSAMCFLVADEDCAESLRRAWLASPLAGQQRCVTWSLLDRGDPCRDIKGGSLGAAFAVGLHELDRRASLRRRWLPPRRLDERTAVTGGIDKTARHLTPVGGAEAKIKAAVRADVRQLVAPTADKRDLRTDFDAAHAAQPDILRIVYASTVADAVRKARTRWDRRFLAATAAFVVTLLAAASISVPLIAQRQAQTRSAQRLAAARSLLAQAEALRPSEPVRALQLAETAHRLHDSPETTSELIADIGATHGLPVGSPLQVPGGSLNAFGISPDGRTVATASEDGTVRLWSIEQPAHPTLLATTSTSQNNYMRFVNFSPDGHTLFAIGETRTVWIWDISDQHRPVVRSIQSLPGPGSPYTAALSPNGRFLAIGNNAGPVSLVDVTDRAQPRVVGDMSAEQSARVVQFSPDGKTLAVAGNATFSLWDVEKPADPRAEVTNFSVRDAVNALAFSPNGRLMATVGGDVRLWNITDPAEPAAVGTPLIGSTDAVASVAFSPDGTKIVSSGEDDAVRLWDITDPAHGVALGAPLAGHRDLVWMARFSPNGHLIVSADAGMLRLWDVTDPAQPTSWGSQFATGADQVRAAVFSPNGRTLYSGDDGGMLRIWDTANRVHPVARAAVLAVPGGNVGTVAGSPDGKTVVTGGDDGKLRLWDVSDPASPRLLGAPLVARDITYEPTSMVYSTAFSPSGQLLASAGEDGKLRLWNVADRAHPIQLDARAAGQGSIVDSVVFAPDSRTLASGGHDGTVRLWHVDTSSKLEALTNAMPGSGNDVNGLAFSPDGDTLAAAAYDGTVRLWNTADRSVLTTRGAPLIANAGPLYAVQFSPGGKLLAAASGDGTVRLWDLSDPAQPRSFGAPLTGHLGAVYSVGFSSDGSALVSAGQDGTMRLWDPRPAFAVQEKPQSTACTLVRTGLSRQDWKRYVNGVPYQTECGAHAR